MHSKGWMGWKGAVRRWDEAGAWDCRRASVELTLGLSSCSSILEGPCCGAPERPQPLRHPGGTYSIPVPGAFPLQERSSVFTLGLVASHPA